MKCFISAIAFVCIANTLSAQDYYYNLSGEKIECEVSNYNGFGITIKNGKKYTKIKSDQLTAVVTSQDSMTVIQNHDLALLPKMCLATVTVAGTIEFYNVRMENNDGYSKMYGVLRKGSTFLKIDNSKKTWSTLFQDNTAIYNKVLELKAKDFYESAEGLIELVKQYNEEAAN